MATIHSVVALNLSVKIQGGLISRLLSVVTVRTGTLLSYVALKLQYMYLKITEHGSMLLDDSTMLHIVILDSKRGWPVLVYAFKVYMHTSTISNCCLLSYI